MTLGREFGVFEATALDHPPQRVAEDVGVVPVVEPPLQFVEIGVEMLGTDLVERTDDRAFQKAPDALYAVRVDPPVSDPPTGCASARRFPAATQ